ncbi:MAG: F0F1 ATP synthase subunit A [Eubacteriales bacterium]
MAHGLVEFQLGGQELWITTTHVSLLLVMATLMILAIYVKSRLIDTQDKPSQVQNIAEMVVEALDGMVSSNMGAHAVKFRNYIGTLFLFILVSNLSGLLGLRPPTADYGVTFALGVISFFIIQVNNVRKNKVGAFKELFEPFPVFFPINVIGEIAVPFSLSLRLFGNIVSGTVMMALIYGLLTNIAFGWPGFLHIYFDIFSGCIQTYVFCMLTMAFTTSKIGVE